MPDLGHVNFLNARNTSVLDRDGIEERLEIAPDVRIFFEIRARYDIYVGTARNDDSIGQIQYVDFIAYRRRTTDGGFNDLTAQKRDIADVVRFRPCSWL